MKETYETDNVAREKQATYKDLVQYLTTDDDKEFTISGSLSSLDTLSSPLPFDLDIFDIVSDKRVNSKPRVLFFLSKLKKAIKFRENELQNVHFNKLSIEESEKPDEIMIDWLYNYFRAFFSFDDKQGDMYGLILNNTLKLEFCSEFKPLVEAEYDSIAEKTVEFVVENIRR